MAVLDAQQISGDTPADARRREEALRTVRQALGPARSRAAEERGRGDELPGHGINDHGFLQPARPMSAIGG